jgi:cell division transport system permease protein
VVASLVLAVVVLGAVVSVVGSTMRMALERRRREVEVLKLVGATDGYVRAPFVLEGAAEGAFGAFAALLLLGVLFLFVRSRFDAQLGVLLGMDPMFLSWPMVLGMVALGGALGAGSSAISLRRLSVA